ncbi:MAG TPA: MATE family efflux transporter [Chloroflexota bacterium]|nr:MATE family efflux transporter [Chloroflexota bacterium]
MDSARLAPDTPSAAPPARAEGSPTVDTTRTPPPARTVADGAPAAARDDDSTIRRLVFNLAWPVIVEQLLQTAVGVVDLLMVSHLGAAAIAGVGVSVQVLFVVFAGVAAIATGTTVLVARFVGAGVPQDANRVLKQSVVLAIGLGLFLAIVGIPGSHALVAALGAEPEVVEAGGSYLQVVFLTATALTLTFVLSAALRGAGDSRTPMLVALGINVVNVAVAFVLIFGHLGFPAMGVVGSAWGAAAGRIAGTLALIVLLLTGGRTGLRLTGAAGWLPDPGLIARLARIGLPSMAEQLSRSVGMLLFSTIVISLGTAVFAAQRISFNIISLSFLPGFGFSMAATALTGQALGAQNPDRARRATWFAVRSACLWMGSMGLLFLAAAPLFMRAFTDDPAIAGVGSDALRVLAFGQPQMALALVLAGSLRGAGDTRFPMVVTSISMWLIRLPVAWLFTTVLGWGLPGAYASFIFGSTLESLAIYLRYRQGSWQRLKV